ncbi:MAG: hypothetical protein A6F71_10475 [Cycloclasticus sp. symbiont of Poecilosclerida sp. M]|nr:MAG: hypothetical protein A6F71_10475 [Cycloclasticus sp. symbiont of Poecilosclerida sp. M]
MQQHILYKASQLKHLFSFNVTERKLLIVFWFFVVSTVINLTAFSEFARKSDIFEAELNQYFSCELGGHNPANPCDRERVERVLSEIPIVLAYLFHGTLPVANLMFVISFQGLRNACSERQAKKSFVTNSRNINMSLAEGRDKIQSKCVTSKQL